MNWGDEEFVKFYTRDTPSWIALGYEAQGLFMHLVRKADRSGVIPLDRQGKPGLALMLRVNEAEWANVVAPALERLLNDGCVELHGELDVYLVIPNYVDAQTARRSDRDRQADSRARRRDSLRTGVTPVTPVTASRPVTNVTSSHTSHAASQVSPPVTNVTLEERRGEERRSLKVTEVTEPDLLEVYAQYPRKVGRQDGLKVLAKSVRTRADLDACLAAVRHFAKANESQEQQYIRHFDRWARSWRDWVDPSMAMSGADDREDAQVRLASRWLDQDGSR